MSGFTQEDTPTVPTDRHAILGGGRRDAVIALRIHGTGQDVELPLDRPRMTIGSAPTCDVVVADRYVSSCHCQLERRDPGRLLVRDRQSKNGTFLNGNRVEVAELRAGGLLTVGGQGLLALGHRSRSGRSASESLIGAAPRFQTALARALTAALSPCNILIIGETGTGKELVARGIHDASPRSLGPFIAVNCGGIPAELVESELFGHEKGAFTGATCERDGVFAQADGGTLFLDELGELPRSQQPHLLRALETRHIRRVGGSRERAVDIRLVAATNRLDLDAPGSPLRDDVFHRLATVIVELPPLRDRRDDIPLLIDSFLLELEPAFGRRSISADTMRVLMEQRWPGNVRELRHAVHRAAALSAHELRLDDLLPRRIMLAAPAAPLPAVGLPSHSVDDPGQPIGMVQAFERTVLGDAYRRHGSVRRAAAALRMPKSTFADRARKLGIL